MSKATWLAAYYPTPASRRLRSPLLVLAHSLRKWQGLLPDALKKHRVWIDHIALRSTGKRNELVLTIGGGTCSLCQFVNGECNRCPLVLAGELECASGNQASAYHIFCHTGSAGPMVDALTRAQQFYKDAQKEAKRGTTSTGEVGEASNQGDGVHGGQGEHPCRPGTA
jgi:hypothetical protein